MITPDEALDLVIQTATPLAPQPYPLAAACGMVLAEDVVADGDYPPFPRSMMDGFAVRLADAGKTVPVIGEIPAGASWDGAACRRQLSGHPDRRALPGWNRGSRAQGTNSATGNASRFADAISCPTRTSQIPAANADKAIAYWRRACA